MRTASKIVALALLFVPALFAQQQTFQLDPAQSKVSFILGATMHTVHGTLRLKPGTIVFDPATGIASGKLIVDAATGETGNDGRDHKMKKDVLETQKYPEIVLTVQRFKGNVTADGVSQGEVSGIMSIHGADHPMTLTLLLTRKGPAVSADATFDIPYVQWGMKDPSTFILRVDKKVQLAVHAVGTLAP
jgi:polyisoprenoid-binding protein YceI